MDNNAIISPRVQLVLDWLLQNQQLILSANTVKMQISVKGTNVNGDITVFPDVKK